MNRLKIKMIIFAIPTENQITDILNNFGKNKIMRGSTTNHQYNYEERNNAIKSVNNELINVYWIYH